MSGKSDRNLTKQIRIDAGWHKILKLRATNEGRSVKELVEDIISDHIGKFNYEVTEGVSK